MKSIAVAVAIMHITASSALAGSKALARRSHEIPERKGNDLRHQFLQRLCRWPVDRPRSGPEYPAKSEGRLPHEHGSVVNGLAPA
jgi:hypothetical protein